MDIQLNLSVPAETKEWRDRRAEETGVGDASRWVEELIRKEQLHQQKARLEDHLDRVLAKEPTTPAAPADWENITRHPGPVGARPATIQP